MVLGITQMSLKLLTLNVRGLRDNIKRRAIFNFYRNKGDIICLQETHSEENDEQGWAMEWGGDILFSHGSTNARGVCTLLKKGCLKQCSLVDRDNAGRSLIFNLEINDVTIAIANIYAPNTDCPHFFEELLNKIALNAENRIILGDFNLVMNTEMDRIGSHTNKVKARACIEKYEYELNLVDIWRTQNPETRRFSWYKCRPALTASRIDFVLISQGLADMCENAGYTTGLRTDHLACYAYFLIKTKPRGSGYWKLNTTHLTNRDYIEIINNTIESVLLSTQDWESKGQRWEYLKYKIRDVSRVFSKAQAGEKELIISQLSEKIDEMEAGLPYADLPLLENTKAELDELMNEKTKECIFRAKVRYTELGEKSTKYYLNMEKDRYNARTCNALYDENNNNKLVTDTKEILKLQEIFYKDLYTSNTEIIFNHVNHSDVKISEEMKQVMSQPFNDSEVKGAIKKLPNGKTCGNDGLPIEIYKVFWTKLQSPYMEMLDESFEQKLLHQTARSGIINMIPKQNKNTKFLKFLRPITLLNSDYKIIEKVMANRLEPAMDVLINCDQRGFLKGRRISSNIRMIFELMKYTEDKDIASFILQLDFHKCFDRIEFTALFGALSYFNFPNYVIEWTKILYTEFYASTQNNGHFSNKFKIGRGVHQGGPCSSLYFLLCAEMMAILLRDENNNIKGIPVNDIKNILGQFADDAAIFSLFEQKSYESIFLCLERFRTMSGFMLNYDKTTVFRIGSMKNSEQTLISQRAMSWTNEPVNILGVWVTHDSEQTTKLNYQEIENKANSILNSWKKRNISLHGKVIIFNALISSLFVYRMTVLPAMSNLMTQRLKQSLINFLWNGAKPKVNYQVLIMDKKRGGLNLCDIVTKDKALKTSWVQILQNDRKLSNIVYANIAPELKEQIWSCSLKANEVHYVCSDKFWNQVMEGWFDYVAKSGYVQPPNKVILWFNSEIKVDGKPIMWRDCWEHGLIYAAQLFNGNKLISCRAAYQNFNLDILRFNALVSALPLYLRRKLKEGNFKNEPTFYDINKNRANLASHAYNVFRSAMDNSAIRIKHVAWCNEMDSNMTYENFECGFNEIYNVTNVAKYRSFQYRLMMRAVVTNAHLYRWKIKNDNLCTFCSKEKETYTHLFVMCEKVHELWIQLERLMLKTNNDEIQFNVENVLFNRIAKSSRSVKNFLCLITKQYIYRQRCYQAVPSFIELRNIIFNVKNTEMYIARKNDKMKKHVKKWGNF